MANGRVHKKVGAIAGIALAFVMSKGQPFWHRAIEIAGGAVGGLLTALVPDWFEPAKSPNHRKFIHGLLFNAGLFTFCIPRLRPCQSSLRSRADREATLWKQAQTTGSKIWHWSLEISHRLLAGAAAGALAGYGSHLVLDALTHRSLPLIA